MHISLLANDLHCAHCHSQNAATEWPLNGDHTALYSQREPGQYSLAIHCPSCDKDWYVVWDMDPGPIKPLGLF